EENVDRAGFPYSVDRLPAYCKEAAFMRGEAGPAVVRRTLASGATPASGPLHFHPADEPYVAGEAWSRALHRGPRRDGWRAEGFSERLHGWMVHGCGLAGVPARGMGGWDADLQLPGESIDLLPHTLSLCADGSACFIDHEWAREGGVTLGYLGFRGLFETLSACPPVARPQDEAELGFPAFIGRLMATAGPGFELSGDRLQSYLDLE